MFPFRRCSYLLGLALSLSCAFAQTAPPSRFPEVSKQAAAAFSENRFGDAARLYREGVKLHPDWAEGWGYLAASLFSLERYGEARDAYRRTTVLTPNNGPSWAYVGFCEYELRDYRKAFDHLVKARELGLGDDLSLVSRVHYELGMLFDTAGQFEMGAKELAFFPTVEDKKPIVLEATGLNVLRMPLFPYEIPPAKHDLVMRAGEAGWNVNGHHIEDAKKIYEQLIAAYPQQANLHYGYGFCLAMSDPEGAVGEMEKELAISPNHVPAMVEAAFLSLEMKQYDKSQELARRAVNLEPKNYAPHNILGRIFIQTGHTERGISELETAVHLAPSIPAAHFNLAQAYQKAGKSAEAAREFAAFKELDHGQEGEGATTPSN